MGVDLAKVGTMQTFFSALRRRSITARLFQPLVRISSRQSGEVQALSVSFLADHKFVGTFAPSMDGELFMFVNDKMMTEWGRVTTEYYKQNRGTGRVAIERL
jgi:hypothetical protein